MQQPHTGLPAIQKITLIVLALLVSVVAHAQTYTVLYNYGTNTSDPMNPTPLGIGSQARDGNFYSTTALGGTAKALTAISTEPRPGAVRLLVARSSRFPLPAR